MGADQATKAVLGAALAHPESDRLGTVGESTLVRSGLLNVKERPLQVSGLSSHLMRRCGAR